VRAAAVYFSLSAAAPAAAACTGGRVSLAHAPLAFAPLVLVLPLPAAGRPWCSLSPRSRGSRSPLCSRAPSLCSPRVVSRVSRSARSRWGRDLPVLVLHSLSPAAAGLDAALVVSRLEAAATAEAEGFTGAEEPLLLPLLCWGRRRSPLPWPWLEPLCEGAPLEAEAGVAAAGLGLTEVAGWKVSASAFSFKIYTVQQRYE
jgi:hypothetical protein